MNRREALAKLAAAGAVGASSALVTSSAAFAAMGSCCTASSSYTLIGVCQPSVATPGGCVDTFTNTISVCRTLASTSMVLARNANGTQRPFFDEIAWVQVTSPLGVARSQNFNGYQVTCALPATFATVAGFNVGSTCGAGAGSPVDVTNLFGTTECGIFTVSIRVRNGNTPKGYSTAYIVPV